MTSVSIRPSRLLAAASLLFLVVCSNSAQAAPFMPTPSWTRLGSQQGANIGLRTAIIGDVNGDGYRDALVTRLRPGDVSLHLGSAQGLGPAAAWVFVPSEHGGNGTNIVVDYLDLYVGSAGDMNGDGFDDVIIGNPYNSLVPNTSGEGKAWIFLGTATGLANSAIWTIDGSGQQERLGFWVGTAGDVNGDGYADVLITGAGAVRLYAGGQSGLAPGPLTVLSGDYRLAAGLGDLNHDRTTDVVVAPRACDQPVKIFGGSGSGLSVAPIYTAQPGGTATCPAPLLAH